MSKKRRLAATLKDYNRAVESKTAQSLAGAAHRQDRKPLRAPYYGLRVVSGITFTMGGILVNGQAAALDENEQPIAGLYAAGDAIGGLMGGYRGGYTGGLMQAVVTGILAGENAARLSDHIKKLILLRNNFACLNVALENVPSPLAGEG